MADPAASQQSPPQPESAFLNRLLIVTISLFLLLIAIHILREFQTVLQPLFIAIFLSYVLLPAHRWVVKKGVPPLMAYIVLLAFILACMIGLGILLYNNLQRLIDQLPGYEKRLRLLVEDLLVRMGMEKEERDAILGRWRGFQPASAQEQMDQVREWLGKFGAFLGALAITAVYLVFVVTERANFGRRILQAFAPANAERVLRIVNNINQAISEYLAVKLLMSFLGGLFTLIILAAFQVDFYVTWGILAFVLNFIPYLGSLVATVFPVGLALVQLGLWQAIVIAILLVAMQQTLGVVVEPRMAGQRLNVSPLLILLALSFWGVVWGIVGMILAVPMLVSLKIVLDNIDETRPLAALMAHVGPEQEASQSE